MTFGRCRVRAGFVLLLSVLVFLDEGMLLWVVWTAAAFHELGHYLALRLAGGRVALLDLHSGGITMLQSAAPHLSYRRELAAVAAGPAASLICALLFSRADGMMMGSTLAGMCLSHGLFNLLPARGLDGGRMLEIVLAASGYTGHGTALWWTTLASLLLIALSGLWLFFQSGENIGVITACVLTVAALGKGLTTGAPPSPTKRSTNDVR